MKILNQDQLSDLEKYFNGIPISENNYKNLYNSFLNYKELKEKPKYANGEDLYLEDFLGEYFENFLELV